MRINVGEFEKFLYRVASEITTLVNSHRNLADQKLQEFLPVTPAPLAREILSNLSRSLAPQQDPDIRVVAHNMELALGLKPDYWKIFREQNPVINVYRFFMANHLIEKILENNFEFQLGNINSLKRITLRIPKEVFGIISSLMKSSRNELQASTLLYSLLKDDENLQIAFVKFVISNFEKADSETQGQFIDSMKANKISPFAELLRRARDLDHAEVNSVSHIMAAFLGIPDAANRNLDDVKRFLFEKLISDKTCLAKSRVLVELLKSSSRYSLESQRVLTEIQTRPPISQNLQICRQLLNMPYEGPVRDEQIPLTLTLHDLPPRIYTKRFKPLKSRIARKPIKPVERKSLSERFTLAMKGILLPPDRLESDEDLQPSLA